MLGFVIFQVGRILLSFVGNLGFDFSGRENQQRHVESKETKCIAMETNFLFKLENVGILYLSFDRLGGWREFCYGRKGAGRGARGLFGLF